MVDIRDNEPVPAEGLVTTLAPLRAIARFTDRPLVKNRSFRWVFLAIVVLGPLALAFLTVVLVPDEPTRRLVESEPVPTEQLGLDVRVNLRNVDADAGEVQGELVAVPTVALAPEGVYLYPVRLGVNDRLGNTLVAFEPGEAPRGVSLALPITGSRSTAYPFDSYDGTLLVFASIDEDGDGTFDELPISLDIDALITDFTAQATTEETDEAVGLANLGFDRPVGVILWAVLFMGMVWGLTLSVAAVAWRSLVVQPEVPFWLWGLSAAILFALPGIRDSLPGEPPYGSVVDFGAFYWGVLMLALTLITLLMVWLGMLRREDRARRA